MTDEWLRKATRPVRIARVDATAPNVARVWNYLVGGLDNFEADRAAVREAMALAPVVADVGGVAGVPSPRGQVPGGRGRDQAVPRHRQRDPDGGRHPRAGAGGGPGLPDRLRGQRPRGEPHARALVLSRPEGVVSYLQADAREPAAIIDAARLTLDLGHRPRS